MKKILQQHEVVVTIDENLCHWGAVTPRWSRKSAEDRRQAKKQLTGEYQIVPGQKAKHEWDCRFCKKECGADGDFADHLKKSHWSENRYARLIPKKSKKMKTSIDWV